MQYIFSSKAALIEALEAMRPVLKELDRRNLAKHKADEKAALQDFRAKLREALKADYATAKEKYRCSRASLSIHPPVCPLPLVSQLDAALDRIPRDTRTRYTISATNGMSDLYWLLDQSLAAAAAEPAW